MLAPPQVRPSAPTNTPLPAFVSKTVRPSPVSTHSSLKRSIDDLHSMDLPSSPSKRSRVTFDSDVEILSGDDEDNLDPLVVKEEVRRAIQRHFVGDDISYELVRAVFATPYDKANAPSTQTLRIYLRAVLANVSTLDKSCHSLVHAVIHSEWVGRDEAYYSMFAKVLGNLAAAYSGYVAKIIQMLVDLLGPQKTRRIPGQPPARQPVLHRRVHQVLKYITQLVPTASGAVTETVRRRLNREFSKSADRLTYIRSFLDMVKFLPELSSDILASVTAELVKLDVAVQNDLDEEDDDMEEDLLHYMSTSQTLVERSQSSTKSADAAAESEGEATDESDSDDEHSLDPVDAQRAALKDTIRQVDQIMDMLFQHYTKAMSTSSLQDRDNAIAQLNAQFHSIILPTYRSRHPQFLIFHFAQASPILVDQFVSSCIHVLVDKKQPRILRLSAAAYFSGFVGRGANVPSSVVSDCVALLCDQLQILRKAYEPGCKGPDLRRYSDFYATMQAILYIFCFRWRDLALVSSDLDDDSDDEDAEPESYQFPDHLRDALQTAFFSSLNPLKICTSVIVEQFANITHALDFMYIHSKIATNRNVRLHTHWRSTSDLHNSQPERDMGWVGDSGVMEGYFPYDPYHLPLSKHWIQGDYVQWKGIPGEEQNESDTEEDGGMDLRSWETSTGHQ